MQIGAAQSTPPPTPPPLATPEPSASPSAEPSASPSVTPSANPLTATPAKIATNIGLQQTIAIGGATGPLVATLDPKIASVAVNGNNIVLGPIRNGLATLHVADSTGGGSVDVPVKVAPNAGTIAPQITLKVTGQNVDPDFIAKQAAVAVDRAVSIAPGAKYTSPNISAPAAPLAPGATTTLSVPVSIAGGDQYLDVNATTQLLIQNVAASPFEPVILHYSDDPEHLLNDGVLYRARLMQGQPVRVYDYHENGPLPRRLVVALTAAPDAPSTVQAVESFAGPSGDVMGVGHAVTKNFLINKTRNQGLIFDLSGGAPFYQRDMALTALQGAANATDFKILSGGPVTITVLAVSPGVNPATLLDAPPLPSDGKNRKGVFNLSNYGAQTLTYAAGGPDAKTIIGDREPTVPNLEGAAGGQDFGDYGVLFNFNFALTNPTDNAQTVFLYEAPHGGPARASYLIDNDAQPVELGCATSPRTSTSPPNRYLIRQFTLGPHASETHVVRTMTDGGSNYPVEIGITATPVQPATPPISAPDGCFPKP